jgi:hypothetical protein
MGRNRTLTRPTVAREAHRRQLRKIFDEGIGLLRKGIFTEGMEKFEKGRLLGLFGSELPRSPLRLFDGTQDLQAKTLLLCFEGALGDHIMYARFARDLKQKGAKVVALCLPPLAVFLSSQKYVDETFQRRHPDRFDHDYWVPSYSLPRLLRYDYATIPGKPYLEVPRESVQKWKEIRKPGLLTVGIRWQGANISEKHALRDVPVDQLVKLTDIPNTCFYSLQKEDGVEKLPADSNVLDLSDRLTTIEDTAAAIMNMDLVISSCTLIPHLCGAIGRPAWVLLNHEHFHLWSYPGDGTTPWYDTVSVFYCRKMHAWGDVFSQVRSKLEELAMGEAGRNIRSGT